MSATEPVNGEAVISGISRTSLGQALSYTKGHPIQRVVPMIYAIATDLDIDPAFAIAEAILESGWGTSAFARNRHNWYGYQAYYEDSSKARQFASDEEGIRTALEAMQRQYFSPGGTYHAGGAGSTLNGWARRWIDGGPASWQRGVRSLCRIMNALANTPDAE